MIQERLRQVQNIKQQLQEKIPNPRPKMNKVIDKLPPQIKDNLKKMINELDTSTDLSNFEKACLGTYAFFVYFRPYSSLMLHPIATAHYLDSIHDFSKGKRGSVSAEKEAKDIFGGFKLNVEWVGKLPDEETYMVAPNHFNGRRKIKRKGGSPIEKIKRKDPLIGFYVAPLVSKVLQDATPANRRRKIRFFMAARKEHLTNLEEKINKLTKGKAKGTLQALKSGYAYLPEWTKKLIEDYVEEGKDFYHDSVENVMASITAGLDYISAEKGKGELAKSYKAGDILGVFPTGEAECALEKGKPEAGKFFLMSDKHAQKRNKRMPVLPTACYYEEGTFYVKIGKAIYPEGDPANPEDCQKAVDTVMIAIGSMLPPDMWGTYTPEIRQLKEQREGITVFSANL